MSVHTKKYTISVLDSFARTFNEQKDLKKQKRVISKVIQIQPKKKRIKLFEKGKRKKED